MTDKNIIPLQGNSAPNTAMVAAESSKAVQEVHASLVIAKQFPRDEEAAHAKIIKACQRVNLADAGIYTYARGGNSISGPSIRLAESMAQYWGNLDFGWRELERRGNTSVIQTYAWDKESNTRRELTFEVKHVRNTKSGSYALKDERDIYENNANNAARRMRACILALIPGDMVDDAVERCELTIASRVTDENVAKLVHAFASFGVNLKMIEARIQRNISAMQPANYIDLRKVYNSLKDGMSGVSTWFDLAHADKKEEKPQIETQVDNFKAENGEKKPVGEIVKTTDSTPLPTSTEPQTEAPANSGATPAPKAAFPGCPICEGSGIEKTTDPQTGEEVKSPCPDCSK